MAGMKGAVSAKLPPTCKYFYGKNWIIRTGTDVMKIIFGDFLQFTEKKLAFFSKTNVMINFFKKLALFSVKNANFFRRFFRRKYF
jgi:hypothetical protein